MASTKTKIEEKVATRPPVVAILGHVDHGKTSLLDFIRKSRLASKEEGGITQHIGAYQIENKGQKITFIDTPGHEAFSAMRARGGKAADIAVLVVAADDGVMPQTKESIAHIKAAGIPFIVAGNKIDLPGANIERVKKDLAQNEVLVEGYGGDIVCVPVSAKTGQGVDDLLEMIQLVSDLAELKSTEHLPFKGIIIEAKLDKFRGTVATVLVKDGKLRVGEVLYTPSAYGKVKAMFDPLGKSVGEAQPSTPVEVLGFTLVPKAGEEVSRDKEVYAPREGKKVISLQDRLTKPTDEIRLIVKADFTGTLEAVTNAIDQLKGENKKIKIFFAETGEITDSNVLLAAATQSLIIGFNVEATPSAKKLAAEERVLIRSYKLIYELLDELREGLEAISLSKAQEGVVGEAAILATFKTASGKVAGCNVTKGRINIGDTVKIVREGKEIARAKIASMKHKETEIRQAGEGEEFGVLLAKDLPFTKGDIIVAIGHQ
jgi:translation initiation factor IF-2